MLVAITRNALFVGLFIGSVYSFHEIGATNEHKLRPNMTWPWLDFPTNPLYSNFSSWADQLSTQFCFMMCTSSAKGDTQASTPSPGCSELVGLRCFPCSCQASCIRYGTCCVGNRIRNESMNESIQTNFNENVGLHIQQAVHDKPSEERNHVTPQKFVCVSSQMPTVTENNTFNLMVRECPSGFQNETVRNQCEGSGNWSVITVSTYVHVTDQVSGITYYNKYCADCNNASKTVAWNLTVDCVYYLFVYTATDDDSFLRQSLDPNSTCDVKQSPPNPEHHVTCEPWWYVEPVSSCNVTGLWQHFDQFILENCEKQSYFTDRVMSIKADQFYENQSLYSNVFCAICNLNAIKYSNAKVTNIHSAPQMVLQSYLQFDFAKDSEPPFSLLLNLDGNHKTPISNSAAAKDNELYCTSNEWAFGYDKTCLPIECSAGKYLDVSKQRCETILGKIRGLGYKVLLHMVPEIPEQAQHDCPDCRTFLVGSKTEIYFKNIVHLFLTSLSAEGFKANLHNVKTINTSEGNKSGNESKIVPLKHSTHNPKVLSHEWYVTAHLVANFSIDRDEFERTLATEITKDVFIVHEESQKILMKVAVIPIPVRVQQRSEKRFACGHNSPVRIKSSTLFQAVLDEAQSAIWEAQANYIQFSRVLVCMHVRFSLQKVNVTQRANSVCDLPHEVIIGLSKGQLLVFSTPYELSSLQLDSTATVSVCLDVLEEKLSTLKLEEADKPSSDDVTMMILETQITLSCLALSIVCLILTVITYSIFSVLRTLAGVYNMLLAAYLLLAQCLLLISSFVRGPNALCTFLGIATHFSWLNLFAWSFNCCFHMFRVFSSNTINTQRTASVLACIVKRVAISAAWSGLIVVCVVIGNYASTSGKEIGYGKNSCYLNTPLLVGLATILPFSVVTVCNTAFFAVVVWKIQRVRELQSSTNIARMDTKQNLAVYVRLSTITGACWILAILAELARFDPLMFVSIVLNGLQGVFIFISYMCNSRVLKLYQTEIER